MSRYTVFCKEHLSYPDFILKFTNYPKLQHQQLTKIAEVWPVCQKRGYKPLFNYLQNHCTFPVNALALAILYSGHYIMVSWDVLRF